MGSNLRSNETNSRLFLPLPSANINFFSDQFLHAGLAGGGDIIRPDLLMRNAALRQLEKERIREEIMTEEIMRRRVLELEVRREMAIERELALRRAEGFSSLPGLGFEGRLPFPARATDAGVWGNAPFQRPPVVADLGNGHIGKVVFLAKPPTASNISGTIRKVAGVGNIKLPIAGSKKKPHKEWGCALCKVSASCQQALNDHLQGKKHKAKEAELKANKTTDNHPKSYIISQNKTDKQEANPIVEDVNKNESNFWCRDCNIRCTSKADVASHQKGKKHMAQLESQRQNLSTIALLGTSDTSEEEVGSDVTYEEAIDNVDGELHAAKVAEEEAISNADKEAVDNVDGEVHAVKATEEEAVKALDSPANKKTRQEVTEELEKTTDESIKNSNSSWIPSPELGKKQEEKPTPEELKKKLKFWCEDCQVGCHCETVMASHQKGKKHTRLQAQKKILATLSFSTNQNDGWC